MTLPRPMRFICLWMCSQVFTTPLHRPAAGAWSPQTAPQSRRWRNISGDAPRTVDPRSPTSPDGPGGLVFAPPWTQSGAYHHVPELLRPAPKGGTGPEGAGCCPGEPLPAGPAQGHGRRPETGARSQAGTPGRAKRSGLQDAGGSLPAVMAQEQGTGPPLDFNISDYDDDYLVPGATPFVPVDGRGRRRRLKNPFYPVTAESFGAYAVLLVAALIFSAGVIGNVSVMCIVCHNYYMRSISNSLLANLALWDFVVVFFCLPLVVFHALTKTWLLGDFSCRIVPYLEVTSLGVTTFTLCALCIDRFRAAANVQMYYEMIENWASTTAKLVVIWVGALLLALPELLIGQLVTEDGDPPDVSACERCVVRISTDLPDTLYVLGLTYNSARLWWYFGCYFCLPTLFTIFSSLITAHKIRLAERTCVRGNKKQIHLESQMNCAVVALAILYGFCIIPENVCNIVSIYMATSIPRRSLDILHLVSQLLLFCKSAVTPLLLFCLCRPFTKAFLECCCCCCEECGPPLFPATANSDTDHASPSTELELSPFSTICREPSTSATYAVVGTHC